MKKIIAYLLAFAFIFTSAFNMVPANAAKKPKLNITAVSVRVGDKTNLKVKNFKKKVKWSIKSGKKYIKLTKKKKLTCVVTAKKAVSNQAVTAVVVAKAGKKKLTTTFTILPTYKMVSGEKKALTNLIKKVKSGTDVSSDLNYEKQYKWDKSGHLIGLNWSDLGLKLSALDLSSFPYLETVTLAGNTSVGALNTSKCTKLKNLKLAYTKADSVDFTNNTALTALDLEGTNLSKIDLSKNLNLELVKIAESDEITELDFSNHTKLDVLYCHDNSILTKLDVSGCTSLTELYCYNNGNLTSLVTSGCTSLMNLKVYGNVALPEVDLTDSTEIEEVVTDPETKVNNAAEDIVRGYDPDVDESDEDMEIINEDDDFTDLEEDEDDEDDEGDEDDEDVEDNEDDEDYEDDGAEEIDDDYDLSDNDEDDDIIDGYIDGNGEYFDDEDEDLFWFY
ncbi:MAG: hypothetical protein K5656_04435 [Lachnospiraceae bacterium]|nr:hypothetical protein [Lachnospiraceae bacterium]